MRLRALSAGKRTGIPWGSQYGRMRTATILLVGTLTFAMVACSSPTKSPAPSTPTVTAAPSPVSTATPARPVLASAPAQLAMDLAADEQTLRDASASEEMLVAAARHQQLAYRDLGRHSDLNAAVRPHISQSLLYAYDRNVDARRQLDPLVAGDPKNTLPAWRIDPPAPAGELLGYYREAETTTGVGWNYLAAINAVETRFGRIVGLSSAGAHGPMQFLPSTFAKYGDGGDILSPHDSIIAAGRYLAANGFADNAENAIYSYNHSQQYVRAIDDYAAVLAADPAAFTGYYRWDVYYQTSAGDVLLPIGYAAASPIPVSDYLATHPQ